MDRREENDDESGEEIRRWEGEYETTQERRETRESDGGFGVSGDERE